MPRDDIELSSSRACLGRLFFQIPGGIKYGQYFLNVKFEKSVVRVPFRILTKDEEKLLNKNYKRHQEAGARTPSSRRSRRRTVGTPRRGARLRRSPS